MKRLRTTLFQENDNNSERREFLGWFLGLGLFGMTSWRWLVVVRFARSGSKVCDYLHPGQIPNFILGISYQVYYKLHNCCKQKTLHAHIPWVNPFLPELLVRPLFLSLFEKGIWGLNVEDVRPVSVGGIIAIFRCSCRQPGWFCFLI